MNTPIVQWDIDSCEHKEGPDHNYDNLRHQSDMGTCELETNVKKCKHNE